MKYLKYIVFTSACVLTTLLIALTFTDGFLLLISLIIVSLLISTFVFVFGLWEKSKTHKFVVIGLFYLILSYNAGIRLQGLLIDRIKNKVEPLISFIEEEKSKSKIYPAEIDREFLKMHHRKLEYNRTQSKENFELFIRLNKNKLLTYSSYDKWQLH